MWRIWRWRRVKQNRGLLVFRMAARSGYAGPGLPMLHGGSGLLPGAFVSGAASLQISMENASPGRLECLEAADTIMDRQR